MRIPRHAQRELNVPFSDEIAAKFDPDLFQYPTVSKRGDIYNLLNGQQRVAGYRKYVGSGWEDQKIECDVYHDLSDKDEARIFLELQIHLNVGPYDKYEKAVNAGNEPQTTVEGIVRACGLVTGRKRTDTSIAAVDALCYVYLHSDGPTLAKTLRIVAEAFGGPGLEGTLIRGVGLVCQRYNGALDFDYAVEILAGYRKGADGLKQDANLLRKQTGCPAVHAIAAAVVDILKKDKRGKNLPPWWKV
jgi:hypothetical protein